MRKINLHYSISSLQKRYNHPQFSIKKDQTPIFSSIQENLLTKTLKSSSVLNMRKTNPQCSIPHLQKRSNLPQFCVKKLTSNIQFHPYRKIKIFSVFHKLIWKTNPQYSIPYLQKQLKSPSVLHMRKTNIQYSISSLD